MYYREEPQAVVAGYDAIIASSPHHVRAVHSLATLRGAATTAAPEYVKEVFDELAETFEEKLVTHLEYRVPWLLVDALKRVERSVFADRGIDASEAAAVAPVTWRVADVGCGTGLCGRLLRPFVAHIVGVRVEVCRLGSSLERVISPLVSADCRSSSGGHFTSDDREDERRRFLRRIAEYATKYLVH